MSVGAYVNPDIVGTTDEGETLGSDDPCNSTLGSDVGVFVKPA